MARFRLPRSQYAALNERQIDAASDRDLYDFALRYARAHQNPARGVVGAGAARSFADMVPDPANPGQKIPRSSLPGNWNDPAARFNPAARLEIGRQSSGDALARRKALARSLARRTTEASRRRALARMTAGYGITV